MCFLPILACCTEEASVALLKLKACVCVLVCVRVGQGELKEAREVMVEANTQEYAFNFLQQSLKNKIQDAEVCV